MFIATGCGTGYLPVSGTVASVLAVFIYLGVARFNSPEVGLIFFYASFMAFVTGLSIWTATLAERWLGEHDPHRVVIDEIAGWFYAMFLLPTTFGYIVAAFVLFRIFDVWKPFPIRRSQALPGGVGITIDDVLAGIYTCILLQVYRLVF